MGGFHGAIFDHGIKSLITEVMAEDAIIWHVSKWEFFNSKFENFQFISEVTNYQS